MSGFMVAATYALLCHAMSGFSRWMGSASRGWPQFKHRLPEVALAGEHQQQVVRGGAKAMLPIVRSARL